MGGNFCMPFFYCEECGAKITSGSRFCEECGTPVPSDLFSDEDGSVKAEEDFFIFEKEPWTDRWLSVSGVKGLIAFNSKVANDISVFKSTLKRYLQFSRKRGIDYYVLDFNKQKVKPYIPSSIESFLELLKSIYSVSKPDYLLLIGDEKSIPDISWENESYDGDDEVYSDLPYLTFNTTSPFWRYKTNFDEAISVGRIPASATDNFSLAVKYFNNAMANSSSELNEKSFGLAAYQWKEESEACFSSLGDNLLYSPEIDLEIARNCGIVGLNKGYNPRLMYFNLHGSDQTEYWYGQKESIYPEAMEPQIIKDYVLGYFVGVEACYGAKYHGLPISKSILLSALSSGCLGFLGSSMIAYGTSKEPGSCADIIVREYLKNLNSGLTSGESYLCALKALVNSSMDDASIKTMAEFALYGDPSLKINNEKMEELKRTEVKTRLAVFIPDVRNSVRYSLCSVSNAIESKLNEYLNRYHKDFMTVQPKHYNSNVFGKNQSIYERDCGKFRQILKVYYDKDGNISKEYLSK